MKQLLVTLCIICSCGDTVAQDDRFHWLIGTWKLEGRNVLEVWISAGPAEWSGKSFSIAGTDTLVSETMSIRFFEGSFHYIPDVAGGQPPINFRITSSDDRSFTAENPAHDFPKIIQYQHVIKNGESFIEAAIAGNGTVIPYVFKQL